MQISLRLVSEFLDVRSLVRAARTCKEWKAIFTSEPALENILKKCRVLTDAQPSEIIESLNSKLPLAWVDFFETNTVCGTNATSIQHLSYSRGFIAFEVNPHVPDGSLKYREGVATTTIYCGSEGTMFTRWKNWWKQDPSRSLCSYATEDIKLIKQIISDDIPCNLICMHDIVKKDFISRTTQRNELLIRWGEPMSLILECDQAMINRCFYTHLLKDRNKYLALQELKLRVQRKGFYLPLEYK